jgi:hypothetical protein
MVLIIDGEELVGAKQNRIVNTTILVPGDSTIVIPVSCVEQGRWSYKSPVFSSEDRIMSSNLRAMKSKQVNYSVREERSFQSDQGAIWHEISNKAKRHDAPSPSMNMGEIYEKEKEFKVLKSKVTNFLKDASKADIETQKSVGEGIDCRLETIKLTGFALCHADQIPHISVFAKPDSDKQNSRMHRFSQRRQYTV